MGIVALVITMVLGFDFDSRATGNPHIAFALFATFVAVLAQCMSIFYFIGTAKQVKDLMADHPRQGEFIQRTRRFKTRVFPPATWAIVFTMAAFIIGGAVHTGALPTWIHTALSGIALAFNVYALVREIQFMSRNNILLDEVAVLVGNPPRPE
jgi:hypothetical protein